jgi:hypothetical protein
MARELPRLVRTQLETIVLGASGPLESGLQSQLIDIIRNSQRELFRAFAASRDPQTSATDAPSGPSTDPVLLDAPPTDMLADINAFFPPPYLPENTLFTYDDLLQNTSGFCPPIGFSSFSDSAYGSLNASLSSGLDSLRQDSFVGGQLPSGTTDVFSQLPGSSASTNDTQQGDHTRPNSPKP